jgi:hypothetical protein
MITPTEMPPESRERKQLDRGSGIGNLQRAPEEFLTDTGNTGYFLKPKQLGCLVGYNLFVATVLAPLLIFLLTRAALPSLTATLVTVLVAGGLGATLCNLRGLFTNMQRNRGNFPTRLCVPFYVRPITGAVTGLCTFFVGSLLVNSLAVDSASGKWENLPGRLPYVALAFLAGFAAQEFMQRLKEVAKTLFSENIGKDVDSQLERRAALHKEGTLDDLEFKAEKANLLARNL